MKRSAVVFLIVMFVLPVAAGAVMPVPSGTLYFEHPPVPLPVLSSDPSAAMPIGIGPMAEGGGTLSLIVGAEAFAGPMDLYVVIFAPSWYGGMTFGGGDVAPYYYNPLASFHVLRPEGTFQPLLSGVVPWKRGISAPVREEIFGKVPTFFLAQGASYYLYLLATPAGSLESYFLWATSFSVFTGPVDCFTMPCPVPLGPEGGEASGGATGSPK